MPGFKFMINYILKSILVGTPSYEKNLNSLEGSSYLRKKWAWAVRRGFSNFLLTKLSLNYPVPRTNRWKNRFLQCFHISKLISARHWTDSMHIIHSHVLTTRQDCRSTVRHQHFSLYFCAHIPRPMPPTAFRAIANSVNKPLHIQLQLHAQRRHTPPVLLLEGQAETPLPHLSPIPGLSSLKTTKAFVL